MYEKLIGYIADRPPEYADSTGKFWDDEHISKYMLEAHLNPDIEAASRRHSFIRASAEWIAGLSGDPRGARLIDLGCGAGIYAEAFDALGFQVTGLDLAKRSVDYAKEQAAKKNRRIDYHCQNYLEMDYAGQFDMATLIYCDFAVLKPGDRALLLKKIRKALKPSGKLILDCFTENHYQDYSETQTISYEREGFWSAAPYVVVTRRLRYPESKTYLDQYVVIKNEQCDCYNIWNHTFSTESLTAELAAAGFSAFDYYGDVSGKELTKDSETICVVAT